MKINSKCACILFLFVIVFCLYGCGKSFDVQFIYDGDVLSSQEIKKGEKPTSFIPEIDGYRFMGWVDGSGEETDPAHIEVSGDVKLYALVLPVMDQHNAYLFCDENGFLHPDSVLLKSELAAAISSLVSPKTSEDQTVAAVMPASDDQEPVDSGCIYSVLSTFFTESELKGIFSDNSSDTVTRADFAVRMNKLLGRGNSEHITAYTSEKRPPDLSSESDCYEDLLEAVIRHSPDNSGQTWENTSVEPLYEPGPHLLPDGRLFACDKNGCLIRNRTEDLLYYDDDGVYTCGNEEMDAFVREWISQALAEHPGYDRFELLRAAYDYVMENCTFVGRHQYKENETGWEIDEGLYMVKKKLGNCYNYAGLFWSLSRGLGYPAVSRARYVGAFVHAWTDIPFDGVYYVFDPCLEAMHGHDRFMLDYEDARYLYYPGLDDRNAS